MVHVVKDTSLGAFVSYQARAKVTVQHYIHILQAKANGDHAQTVKRRQLIQDSYKLDCPAQVSISRTIQYISHKVRMKMVWRYYRQTYAYLS